MTATNLRYLPRDLRDYSPETISQRQYRRLKAKTLKQILLHRFLNHYGSPDKHRYSDVPFVEKVRILYIQTVEFPQPFE